MRYQNNPCNLRWSVCNNWKGQLAPKNGFCQFDTLEHGLRATLKTLETYRRRGKRSIRQIISTFAPPSENATDVYIEFICSRLHRFLSELPLFYGVTDFSADYIVSSRSEYAVIVSAMCQIESRSTISYQEILAVMVHYNIFKRLN